MNITWGFINASQQSPKIMKARSKGVGGDAGASSLFTQHLPARDEGFWSLLSWALLSAAWQEKSREAAEHQPKSVHLQHKWTELIVHVWGDGGPAHTVQCLQNMEIINLIEQCCKRGFERKLRKGQINDSNRIHRHRCLDYCTCLQVYFCVITHIEAWTRFGFGA